MERHRRHQIGLCQELGPRPGQPAAEGRRQIGPIGMLEGEQQGPAAGVVAEHRPGPVEDGRGRPAGRAELIGPQLDLERIATTPTEGRGKELDGRPAAGAERSGLRSSDEALAAADAARRQDQIEEPSGRPAEGGGNHG